MTLGGALSGRDNALNFVRLLLAAVVIVSHAWPVGGFGDDPSVSGVTLGAWAVFGFFAISGYLISASRDRRTLRPFFTSRALRIFPGYWASLVAVVAIFAPLGALLTGTRADLRGGSWFIVSNLSTVTVTPGFGEAIHHMTLTGPVWNGPVWTIHYELLCYGIIGLAFCVRRVRVDPGLFAVALLMLVTALNWRFGVEVRGSLAHPVADFCRMFAYFAAGAVLWAFRDQVRVRATWAGVAAAVLVVLSVTRHVDDFGALPVAYLVLWLGARLPVRWGRRTDLSYGVYVYGWPVQCVLSLAGAAVLGPVGFAAVALVGAGAMAALSWRFVELPAMRIRSRVASSRATTSPGVEVAAPSAAPMASSV